MIYIYIYIYIERRNNNVGGASCATSHLLSLRVSFTGDRGQQGHEGVLAKSSSSVSYYYHHYYYHYHY